MIGALFFNLIFVGLTGGYLRRKRLLQAGIMAAGLICGNVFFINVIDGIANNAAKKGIVCYPAPVDPGPPERKYDFIKKHVLERDKKTGVISAVDEDFVKLALTRGNPRQVFQDSFYVMTGKENRKLEGDTAKLDYAKFIILLYYGESEPIYPKNAAELADELMRRINPAQKKIGSEIEEALKSLKPDYGYEVKVPFDYEWDVDGPVVKFDSPEAAGVFARISKADFLQDYDGGTLFRVYSYSLRYNELIEWQFKVFDDGEVWINKLFTVSDTAPAGEGENEKS